MRGVSYRKRVADIGAIYQAHVNDGLSNREIWCRYVYPVYGISERTFYNILNAPQSGHLLIQPEDPGIFDDFFKGK